MNDAEKTSRIESCKSFNELYETIREIGPFISYSRPEPVTWEAEKLIERIEKFLDGGEPNLVTRANGIREKVLKLKYL